MQLIGFQHKRQYALILAEEVGLDDWLKLFNRFLSWERLTFKLKKEKKDRIQTVSQFQIKGKKYI